MIKYILYSFLSASTATVIQILNYHYLDIPFTPDIISMSLLIVSIVSAMISISCFIRDVYKKINSFLVNYKNKMQ